MSARTDLHGARWSSAVRCIAKAEYQALGAVGDPEATFHLTAAFARGVNAADNWVQDRRRLHEALGDTFETEVAVPWGPGDRWTGHADAVVHAPGAEVPYFVMEAYHAKGGEFREVKALQVAFYARKLSELRGVTYAAMLVALDTTVMTEDGGFEVTTYPVDVDALTPRTYEIEARIGAAYADGVVDPLDRVGDSPEYDECKHCQFRAECWAGYVPPPIEEHPEIADAVDRLALAQSNRYHLKAALDEAEVIVRALKDEVRPYVLPGQTIRAGGVTVKRIQTAPRKSFRLTDYMKAGHLVTPTMLDYARESEEPGERWYITRAGS